VHYDVFYFLGSCTPAFWSYCDSPDRMSRAYGLTGKPESTESTES